MAFIFCLPLHDAAIQYLLNPSATGGKLSLYSDLFFPRAKHYEVFVTLMVKLNGKDHEAMQMGLLICQQPADFCFLFYPVTANG